MDIPFLLALSIAADVVLCAAIFVLLRRTAAAAKGRNAAAADQDLKRLREMLDESRQAAANFLEAVGQSRRSLKELSFQLAEKERSLKDLLRQGAFPDAAETADAVQAVAADRYGKVIAMVKKGMAGSEIAQKSGIPEGEVNLIVDLERAKSEKP